VAGRLLLFSLLPLIIITGRVRGCRPPERVVVAAIAASAGTVLAGSLILLEASGAVLAAGAAYASLAILTGALAMLIGSRPEPGGGDEGPGTGGGPEGPPPFDWDDFERRFWDDVRRRASSGSGRPASGRPPSRQPSRR
jgi:hypothetical protein